MVSANSFMEVKKQLNEHLLFTLRRIRNELLSVSYCFKVLLLYIILIKFIITSTVSHMPRVLQLCYPLFTSQLLLHFIYFLISKNIAKSLRQTAVGKEKQSLLTLRVGNAFGTIYSINTQLTYLITAEDTVFGEKRQYLIIKHHLGYELFLKCVW